MNRQLAGTASLPTVVTLPDTLPMSSDFRRWLQRFVKFTADLTRELGADLREVHDQINNAVQGVGEPIASAATITVDHAIHHVTGAAVITTITAPPGFSGPIWLVADGAWSVGTGGNIALTKPATVNAAMPLIFDPGPKVWYPVG